MKIYALEYEYKREVMGVYVEDSKISSKAFKSLDDAIKEIEWRSNGSATRVEEGNDYKWHWVDNGDRYYNVIDLDVDL